MLMTLLSGLNLTQVSGVTSSGTSAVVDRSALASSDPVSSVPKGYHFATEADIQLMKEQLIVPDGASSISSSSSGPVHATGLATPTDTELESLVGNILISDGGNNASSSTPPSTYDLSVQPYFPPVRDQASEGACAAFSTIYYNFGYLEALDNGWTDASLGNDEHLLSPSWTYNKVVLYDPDTFFGGSMIEDNALVAKHIGISTWSDMPFVDGDQKNWGSETAWRDAPLHQISNIIYYPYSESHSSQIILEMKDAVASNHPVTFAMDAHSINGAQTAFADGNFILSSNEYYFDPVYPTNHAVTIVGYDDNMTSHGDTGAFKVVNSWGPGWGDNGYFWVTYDTIKKIGENLQAISLVDKIDYQPSDLAVYHFDYRVVRDASITFTAIRKSDNTIMGTVSPFFDTNLYLHDSDSPYYYTFVPSFMCQDISQLSTYVNNPLYKIQLSVVSQYPFGNLSSYRLEECSSPYVVGKAIAISPEASGLPLNITGINCLASTQLSSQSVVSPSEALSYYDGAITFNGTTQWVGVRNVQGRAHVMQSGDVGDSNTSTLIAMVEGPGTFSYDWKVSSEPTFDNLTAYVDGIQTYSITGETSWSTETTVVPSGIHYLSWSYVKDQGVSANDDCGWLDNFTWNGRSASFFEDFEPYSMAAWNSADTNAASGADYWGASSLMAETGTHSMWCSENGTGNNGWPNHLNQYYDRNMSAYTFTALPDLTGVTTARLSFEYWANTDSLYDHVYVRIYDGLNWRTIWNQTTVDSGGWRSEDMAIPAGTRDVEFCFNSSTTAGPDPHLGVFIDDVMLTISGDAQAPTSSIAALPTYTRAQTLDLTVSASDTGGSGVAFVQIYYRYGSEGDYTLYTNAGNPTGLFAPGIVNVDLAGLGLGDGQYSFYSVATDRSGNREVPSVGMAVATILDRTAPVTAYGISGKNVEGTLIFVSPVNITLDPHDQLSGVATERYALDGGAWTDYTGKIGVVTEGNHTISFRATDAVGNVETVQTVQFVLDWTAPTSRVSLTGSAGSAGWYVSPVVANITASDRVSGIMKIVYSLDGGTWTNYSGNMTLNGEGIHSFRYLAIDNAGNNGTANNLTIRIDTLAPVTGIAFNGTGNPDQRKFNSSVVITLSPTDPTSGTAVTQYSIDSGTWTTYTSSLSMTVEGTYNIRVRSTDHAGNVETTESVNYTIDKTAPRSGLTLNGNVGTNGWYNGTVYAVWDPTDNYTGVQMVRYRLDGGVWTTATGTLNVTVNGHHDLDYFSVDNANNSEQMQSVSFKVDTVLPEAVIDLAEGTRVDSSTLTVALNVSDNGSGIESVFYKVDDQNYTSSSGGKIVMTGLSDGAHTLYVRVTDQAGNVLVKEVNFSVGPANNDLLPFLLLLILLIIAAIVVAAVIIKRRRKKRKV